MKKIRIVRVVSDENNSISVCHLSSYDQIKLITK